MILRRNELLVGGTNRGGNVPDDIGIHHVGRDSHGIHHGAVRGRPMADDADAVDSQQHRAARVFGIERVIQRQQ